MASPSWLYTEAPTEKGEKQIEMTWFSSSFFCLLVESKDNLGRGEVEIRRGALDHLGDENAQRPNVNFGTVFRSLDHLRSLVGHTFC